MYVYDGYNTENGPKSDTLYTLDEAVNLLLLNSSSLRLFDCEREVLEKYKNDDVNNEIDGYKEELLEEVEEALKENYFYTFEGWNGGGWPLEEDETSYTTESGDEIMIRAKFGYDG